MRSFKVYTHLRNSWYYLRHHSTLIIEVSFALLCIVLIWWFFREEKTELSHVPAILQQARPFWIGCGVALAVLYVLIQAQMYRMAFKSTQTATGITDMVSLFLKRNFSSVFLPAGGVSSLALFGQPLEKKGIAGAKIHMASILYGFSGIVSVIIVAIPVFISTLFYISLGWATWLALALMMVLTIVLLLIYRSLRTGGKLKNFLENKIPVLRTILEELSANRLTRRYVLYTIFWSIVVEMCGIAHLYIAMNALGAVPSLLAAAIGYIVAVVFMVISPFLRGLGAVELSMAYLLTRFGYDQGIALSTIVLYRIFEFWIPLSAGLLVFIIPWNRLLLRIIPAALLILSGIVNILSVLTPAIGSRLVKLRHFIPVNISHASNFLVFATGIFMMITGMFLLRAQRSAWVSACILSIISIGGNLLKAYDYEEAILSAFVLLSLSVTRKQYFVKGTATRQTKGLFFALVIFISMAWIYGTLGFYSMNPSHLRSSFTLSQAFLFNIREFALWGNEFTYTDASGRLFIRSVNLLGFSCFIFLIYILLQSWLSRTKRGWNQQLDLAAGFVHTYGNSSMDYFKYYRDKQLFWSANRQAFIAFKVADVFAIALEKPVATNLTESERCIMEFETYCKEIGYSPVYYRVSEKDLHIFDATRMKHFFLGQEAIVDLNSFSLEGKEKKSLRNTINKLKTSGYTLKRYQPPQSASLIDKLENVSREWLQESEKREIIFAEGMFARAEIEKQAIVTLEREGELFAFLNIIPDHAPEEGTYDLIRKRHDAPNGAMDGLLLELFSYFRAKGRRYVNLGMAPMSGIGKASNIGEQVIKFAYEHTTRYGHYKGLREFKEKYDPSWYNVYLLYKDEIQLIGLPKALKQVMRTL